MMWNSIANLKENLNKIALDVHDDDDDDEDGYDNEILSIYNSPDRRRLSQNPPHAKSPAHSPLSNGFGSPSNPEIEKYKEEIKRLQESEAAVKALSVNYAALLKEKEDQIFRLNEENGSLKQNLLATNAALNASRNTRKGNGDQSPVRQNKATGKNRSAGSYMQNGAVSKPDGLINGISLGNTKELEDLLEEKTRSLAEIQATHELNLKEVQVELEKETGKLTSMQQKLQEEQKLNGSLQQELRSLKLEKDKLFEEMTKFQNELNKKQLEITQMQTELNRRDGEEAGQKLENLRRTITTLEKEKNNLKTEKDKLEVALKETLASSAIKEPSNKDSSGENQMLESSTTYPGKEQMELSLEKLEKDLNETRRERDKALQQLNRLKQHLLDKESEESEKMDEDSKIIQELREKNEYQRSQILHLENALRQATVSREEIKTLQNEELKKSKEVIDELNTRLSSCMSTINAKNTEVLNLQTALGQYYAEIEARERLGEDLALAKEESANLTEQLKSAYEKVDTSKREKEEVLDKLSEAERAYAEVKNRVNKLEEDNEKLRRALEQSMTRLNRMSMDSDYFVDRRIVIKLLVTYFQRNHSKEVLDLMVRMLGFSDEDKQRIGIAQQGTGKGVVRGVLGLPGRLVGGILGGNSGEASSQMASDNQSFADLWVDFLLKETEEREKREAEAAKSKGDQDRGSPLAAAGTASPSPVSDPTTSASLPRSSPFLNHNQNPVAPRRTSLIPDHTDSEFSTVPLTSADNRYQTSSFPRRY